MDKTNVGQDNWDREKCRTELDKPRTGIIIT